MADERAMACCWRFELARRWMEAMGHLNPVQTLSGCVRSLVERMEGAEAQQENRRVWRAIMVLVFFTGLHSYVGVSLYAYVGFMVVDLTGGNRNGAGYVTGFMASSSYLGRFLSSCIWGHLADCLGRKPLMIISLSSMMVFPIVFGLAQSVEWAITSRFLLGMTCPGHIVIRTMTPEVAGSSRVVEATGNVSGAIGLAMAVGPAIGGLLAQPTNHFPAIFPSNGLFARYPYLLPNLVSAPLAAMCIVLTILFVPETRAPRKDSGCRRPSKSCLDRKEYLEVVASTGEKPWMTPMRMKPGAKDNGHGPYGLPGGEWSTPGKFVLPSCVGKFVSPAHLRSHASPPSRTRSRGTPPHPATTPATPVWKLSRTLQAGGGQASPPHSQGVSITSTSAAHVELPVTPSRSMSDVSDDKDLGDGESPDPEIKPIRGRWQLPRVLSAVCGAGLMELILTSFDEVYPLWAMSTRNAGGLSWDMVLVGKVFFVSGMVHFLYMFVGYNWIAEKFGVARVHRAAGLVSVVLSTAVPFIGYLDWSGAGIFTISLVLVTLINSTSFMLYNAVVMASTSSMPPKLRGKIAGFMSAGVGLGGFLGPFALSIAFAWSISTSSPAGETPLVNQHFVFNVGAVLRALLLMLLWKDLTEETLTEVIDDVPGLESLPPLELESIHEDHNTGSPGTLALGDRRVNLV